MFVQQVGNQIVSQLVATSQTEWYMGESSSHHLVFHHIAIQLQFYSLPTFHECFLLDGLLYSPRNLEVLPKTKKEMLYETHLGRGTTACKLLVFYAVCRILFDQEKEISFLWIQILHNAVTEVKFMTDSSLCPQLSCRTMPSYAQNSVLRTKIPIISVSSMLKIKDLSWNNVYLTTEHRH